MPDDFENSRSTVGFITSWPGKGTVVYVSAAGWPAIFTTYMGGVGSQEIGENTTPAFGVYVESATHLGTKGNDDETRNGC